MRIAFAAHDHDTAEYIGKHLGTATVTTTSVNDSGQSYSQHARPLLNPDEVSRAYTPSRIAMLGTMMMNLFQPKRLSAR